VSRKRKKIIRWVAALVLAIAAIWIAPAGGGGGNTGNDVSNII
jgi:hypothetical protein